MKIPIGKRKIQPVARAFSTFREWNESDFREWFSMTPQERLEAARRMKIDRFGPPEAYPRARETRVEVIRSRAR